MKFREVMKRITDRGGREVRRQGSHARVVCGCGQHRTVVPDHGSHDIAIGTLRAIERHLACFGKEWLR